MKYAGNNAKLMARFVRTLTGHAPIGEFRKRFKLDGSTSCQCGEIEWSVKHVLIDCTLWYRKHDWFSRQLQSIQELDPFKSVGPFLESNPLAFSFEVENIHNKALEAIENGQYASIKVRDFFEQVLFHSVLQHKAQLLKDYQNNFDRNPDEIRLLDHPLIWQG